MNQNLTPNKSHAYFPIHKNFQRKIEHYCWIPPPPPAKFPPLNQASQKKILAKISLPQKSRNGKFQTPKNRSVIPVTWNPEYSPSPPGISVESDECLLFYIYHLVLFHENDDSYESFCCEENKYSYKHLKQPEHF